MNHIRINELIDAFFNCALEGEDRASLERALMQSPQARDLFWRKAEIHEGLREWGIEHWDQIGEPIPAGSRSPRAVRLFRTAGRMLRTSTIPLTLLVGSVVGMGLAWAVAPQVGSTVSRALRLANPGFEDRSAGAIAPPEGVERLEKLPTAPGAWAGDRVRVCEAEHGITPVEGSRMLALERALPGPGDPAETRADSCDLFQIIDLAAHRREIAQGGCTLTASAQLLDADAQRMVPTDFVVRAYVFAGDPDSVLAGWPDARIEALAAGSERVTSWGGHTAWRTLTAQASIPRDATFAVLQIDATNMDRTPGRPAAVFDRHYCDDVRLTLTVPLDRSIGH